MITLTSHALWGLLPKSSGWALTSSQRRKLPSFTEKPGPAVNCCFLVLTSAWLPRAQCTQNYNVIRQAGAERGQLLRKMHTRGREVQRPFWGHPSCVFVFLAEGGWNIISMQIILWIMAWERCDKGLRGVLFFLRGCFPLQGWRETSGKGRLPLIFSDSDLGCCSYVVCWFPKQISAGWYIIGSAQTLFGRHDTCLTTFPDVGRKIQGR